MTHDHICHCGTSRKGKGHETGTGGCERHMSVQIPIAIKDGRWLLGETEITDYSLRFQRGYYQHPCGCWSFHSGSVNSEDIGEEDSMSEAAKKSREIRKNQPSITAAEARRQFLHVERCSQQ